MKKVFLLSFFSVLIFAALPNFAEASDTEVLKQEVATMKANLDNANTKLADAMNQLSTLQQDINSMKGVTESGNYYYNEQTRAIREYDQRLRALEDKMGAMMTLLKEIKESAAPGAKTAGADESQVREYQKLLDSVMSEDYGKALPGFQAFLQKYPKSSFADGAQYWIAESYYGLNDYKKAISEYQMLIQKYPRSEKAKTALFKQGLSFMGLKMYNEGRPFFEKVISDYPNTTEAAQASGRIKEIDRLLAQGPAQGSTPTSNPAPIPNPSTPEAAPPSPGNSPPPAANPPTAVPKTNPLSISPPPKPKPNPSSLFD
jgi:tol-pal system protein YbgF